MRTKILGLITFILITLAFISCSNSAGGGSDGDSGGGSGGNSGDGLYTVETGFISQSTYNTARNSMNGLTISSLTYSQVYTVRSYLRNNNSSNYERRNNVNQSTVSQILTNNYGYDNGELPDFFQVVEYIGNNLSIHHGHDTQGNDIYNWIYVEE